MRIWLWIWIGTLLLAACTSSAFPDDIEQVETPLDEIDSLAAPSLEADGRLESTPTRVNPTSVKEQAAINRRIITDEEYSFPSLIPFDGIRPIYDPAFVVADEAPYEDEELVMGVAFDGAAKTKSQPLIPIHGRQLCLKVLERI